MCILIAILLQNCRPFFSARRAVFQYGGGCIHTLRMIRRQHLLHNAHLIPVVLIIAKIQAQIYYDKNKDRKHRHPEVLFFPRYHWSAGFSFLFYINLFDTNVPDYYF